jgi:hypothetical protein
VSFIQWSYLASNLFGPRNERVITQKLIKREGREAQHHAINYYSKKKKKGKKRKKKKGVFCPLAQFCRLKLITDYHAFLTFISSITPSINKTKRKGTKGEKSNRTIYIYR